MLVVHQMAGTASWLCVCVCVYVLAGMLLYLQAHWPARANDTTAGLHAAVCCPFDHAEDLGRAALQKLQEQEATAAAIAAGRLTWHALDITSATSITALADWLRKEHGGRLDVLVNNAGEQ